MKQTLSVFLFIALSFWSTFALSQSKKSHPRAGSIAKDVNAPGEEINMSEPPFWVSSYEEFQDFQKFQKDFYLEKLLPHLKEIPQLEPVSQRQLREASEFSQEWNRIRRRIYIACQDKEMKRECSKIEEIRLQTLNLLANQKLENRAATEESEKVNQSK